MKGLSDIELLDAYARERSEDAFHELVARHVDFIYSAAMRQLRNPHLAEEATQSAFIALAGKAGRLGRSTVIAGWLHHAVHFAALNLLRSETRRKHWEEEAATISVSGNTDPGLQELALPHVDGALAELSESDRNAVILRFLHQLSFRDVAQTLGTSEEAAKKRVNRALERLRGLLAQRGVAISAVALATGLSQMPVTAAPAALSSTLTSLAVSTAVPTSPITAILNLMKTTKAKLAVAIGLVIVGASATLLWAYRSGNPTTAPNPVRSSAPKINVVSVMVDDQDKALKFYTEVLGFVKKFDVPTGEPGGARWLTVVSADEPNGTQLLLEPIGFAPARTYQKALFEAGIPIVSFASGDIRKQFERLKSLGVKFSTEPAAVGATSIAVFEDTFGNYIKIFQTPAISNSTASTLKIKLSSVMVDDQDKALRFYTEILGFVKKRDIPAGAARWLTVVSPEEPDGTELLLELRVSSPARIFHEELYKAGIPLTQFAVADVQDAYERMTKLGVVFRGRPTKIGPTTIAMFDDTCGNLIQLIQI
jgi:RNA polymerase sigma factor (sigma-70 family)